MEASGYADLNRGPVRCLYYLCILLTCYVLSWYYMGTILLTVSVLVSEREKKLIDCRLNGFEFDGSCCEVFASGECIT